MIQAHFFKNPSLTSQLDGSDGSPQTTRPDLSSLLGTMQNSTRSKQSSESSKSSPARRMLFRIVGKGKRSSQGWWGTMRWRTVGRSAGGGRHEEMPKSS